MVVESLTTAFHASFYDSTSFHGSKTPTQAVHSTSHATESTNFARTKAGTSPTVVVLSSPANNNHVHSTFTTISENYRTTTLISTSLKNSKQISTTKNFARSTLNPFSNTETLNHSTFNTTYLTASLTTKSLSAIKELLRTRDIERKVNSGLSLTKTPKLPTKSTSSRTNHSSRKARSPLATEAYSHNTLEVWKSVSNEQEESYTSENFSRESSIVSTEIMASNTQQQSSNNDETTTYRFYRTGSVLDTTSKLFVKGIKTSQRTKIALNTLSASKAPLQNTLTGTGVVLGTDSPVSSTRSVMLTSSSVGESSGKAFVKKTSFLLVVFSVMVLMIASAVVICIKTKQRCVILPMTGVQTGVFDLEQRANQDLFAGSLHLIIDI